MQSQIGYSLTMLKYALAAVCGLTLAACAYLSLSYIVLRGTADLRPVWALGSIAGPAALILVVLAVRWSAAAGGVMVAATAALLWFGWMRIAATLSASHFEGYDLVLGAMSIATGALAVIVLARSGWHERKIALR